MRSNLRTVRGSLELVLMFDPSLWTSDENIGPFNFFFPKHINLLLLAKLEDCWPMNATFFAYEVAAR